MNIFKIEIPDNRNYGLDLLRFIAISAVLISHSIAVLPPAFDIIHKFIFDGVLIFFVLSGFLIGRILIRDFQENIDTKKIINFWKRRWFRTLPAYYFTILLIVILCYMLGIGLNKMGVIKSLFFVQNIGYRSDAFFAESWSLAIEEWFYLLIPLLLFVLNKIFRLSMKANIVVIFVIVLLFSLITRSYVYSNIEISSVSDWDMNLRSPVITRLDSLLMGVLGAWFFIYKKDFFKKNKNILFIIGLAIFICNKLYVNYGLEGFSGFYICVLYFSVVPFSILLTIPALYYMRTPTNNYLRKTISIGSLISYSMYLVNLTIVSFIILVRLDINVWMRFVLFWVLTVGFSILMYKYIETPFMKLRDKK